MTEKKTYTTFEAFWPFYLHQHSNHINRILHFIGTLIAICFFVAAVVLKQPLLLFGMPVAGYGFAWVGHFRIEMNRPATFKYPFFSLYADYKLFFLMLLGKFWAPGPVVKWDV